jgi:redox-sensitive bicupin YhaK (pirin superfamily)
MKQVDDKYIVLEPGKWTETDPFLLLPEDWFSTSGFDWHPHRGIETITVILEGDLEHHDNHGGHGVLKPGRCTMDDSLMRNFASGLLPYKCRDVYSY